MIVSPVDVRDRGDRVERASTLRWQGGEFELRCAAPAEIADRTPDASGFLCAALPLAMGFGEDLTIEGPVSPRLLGRLEELQALYAAWAPGLRPVEVAAHAGTAAPEAGRERVSFLSRGVDSLFTAARHPEHSAVVFVDGLETRHDEEVRAAEVVRAGEAAATLGKPMHVCWTNVRELVAAHVADWEDFSGTALAFVSHQLAGGVESALFASGDEYATVEPCGSSPLLDPLLSSERVEIEHDSLARARLGKIRWLAGERPDLLAYIKVCYSENRPDNCGRCAKCLYTMACLRAAGALEAATGFPDEIDLEALGRVRVGLVKSRIDWTKVAAAEGQDPRVREVMLERIRATPLFPGEPSSIRARRLEAVVGHALADSSLGLVRAVDGARHVYGIGAAPGGVVTAELGALGAVPGPGTRPVRMSSDGRLHAGDTLVPGVPTAGRRARWVLAPLAWRDVELPMRRRVAAVGWRARRALRSTPAPPQPATPPVGHLHTDPAPGRVALYAALHPITGDQLLTTSPREAGDLGYAGAVMVGHLDAAAPVTGRLGFHATPDLVWASRFGRRARR